MQNTPRSLDARAYRDGKWWTIEIPELSSLSPAGGEARIVAMGQARNVKEIQAAAVDLAAVWLDVDESAVDVHVTIAIPGIASELFAQAKQNEETAREAVSAAARQWREAVRALTADGLSQADAARILELSPQRISQLTH